MKTKAVLMLMLLVLVAATLVQGEPEPSYVGDCGSNGGSCVSSYCPYGNRLNYFCPLGRTCCRRSYG
uniref:Panusin n=1 Tax=Panulirus argus TaxID=6737 RepID=PANSN_PANAR|nr:RecName: Full=Panusin; AltName: Full=Defensin-like peptide 7; Short=PaD7; Flags: Precursor [Panulirus argus]ALQ10737.1 Panusin precursor [Panulirus argus]